MMKPTFYTLICLYTVPTPFRKIVRCLIVRHMVYSLYMQAVLGSRRSLGALKTFNCRASEGHCQGLCPSQLVSTSLSFCEHWGSENSSFKSTTCPSVHYKGVAVWYRHLGEWFPWMSLRPSCQRHTQAFTSVFPLGLLLQAPSWGLWIPIWALPLMGCMTLGQLLNLGVLFPQL